MKHAKENESNFGRVFGRILLILFMLVVISIAGVLIWYKGNLGAHSKESDIKRVTIEQGNSTSQIANTLEENGVIKSATAMKVYCRLNNKTNLMAGKYDLDASENVEAIVEHLIKGDVASDEVKITLVEGKTLDDYAEVIANKTSNSKEDVIDYLTNEEYIDSLIEKYWFMTDDIKQDGIYFALEGYILPETYIFEKEDDSLDSIFNKIFDHMDEFLSENREELESKMTVHECLTLASMAEKEANSYEDRQEVVGVFVNRLRNDMNLGSDVTTYYAAGVKMSERNLYKKELNMENPYNTRGPNMAGKLPIGPICNPSKEAIKATINYKETDALFFVADKNLDVYFTKTDAEHQKMIQKLKDEGLWYEYE